MRRYSGAHCVPHPMFVQMKAKQEFRRARVLGKLRNRCPLVGRTVRSRASGLKRESDRLSTFWILSHRVVARGAYFDEAKLMAEDFACGRVVAATNPRCGTQPLRGSCSRRNAIWLQIQMAVPLGSRGFVSVLKRLCGRLAVRIRPAARNREAAIRAAAVLQPVLLHVVP